MLRRLRIGSRAAILLLLAACQSAPAPPVAAPGPAPLPYYNTPDFTPLFLTQPAEVARRVPHTIGGFALRNQDSVLVTPRAVAGKVYVANFFFTRCGSICPPMMDNLARVARAFRADSGVAILSFSVDPGTDGVSRLRRYAAGRGIGSGNWHLLTGPRPAIYTLARQSYFAEKELGFSRDSADFVHTEHFVLVDQDRRIRGIYNGTLTLDVTQLMADIRQLRQARGPRNPSSAVN